MQSKNLPFLAVGILGMLVFIGSGVFLRMIMESATDMSLAERHTHRANHVYIAFAALINLVAFASGDSAANGVRRVFRRTGLDVDPA